MAELTFQDFSQADWRALAGRSDQLALIQTWAYGRAKAATGPWTVERAVLADARGPGWALQALVRTLPFGLGGVAWVNRGPFRLRDDSGLEPVLSALRHHYVDHRGLYLRIALPVLEGSGEAAGALREAGYAPTGTPGWASAVVNLSPPEEEIRQRLHRKWRNHLNKGERGSLTIRSGSDPDTFATFLAAYEGFLADKAFETTTTPAFLAALQDALDDAEKMTAFLAYDDGAAPVASVLMATYGATCEYLVGTLEPAGRASAAGQVLLWRALMAMKAAGFTRCDLSGMDPLRTPKGIFEFKDGVGGTPYRLIEEYDAAHGLIGRLVRWRVGRALAAR